MGLTPNDVLLYSAFTAAVALVRGIEAGRPEGEIRQLAGDFRRHLDRIDGVKPRRSSSYEEAFERTVGYEAGDTLRFDTSGPARSDFSLEFLMPETPEIPREPEDKPDADAPLEKRVAHLEQGQALIWQAIFALEARLPKVAEDKAA